MATSNFNQQQVPYIGNTQQAVPIQFPYGTNNLLTNTPYDNYMGRQITGQQQIFNQNQYLKCRPVASKEEARAFQIDLDGSLWVFTDTGNGKIYTKQINKDGKAAFNTYAFVEDENPSVQNDFNNYVTRDEFTKALQKIMAAMQVESPQGPVPTSASNKSQENNSSVLVF